MAFSDIEADVLDILRTKPGMRAHGLDIGLELARRTGKNIGPGTFYRVLHRLEREGLLDGSWETEEEAATHPGPPRYYYEWDGLKGMADFDEYWDRMKRRLEAFSGTAARAR